MIRNIRTNNLVKFRSSHYYALLKEQERGGEKSFLKKDIARLQKEARPTSKRGGGPPEPDIIIRHGNVTFEIRALSPNHTGDGPNLVLEHMLSFLFEYLDDRDGSPTEDEDVDATPRMYWMMGAVFKKIIDDDLMRITEDLQAIPIRDYRGLLVTVPCRIIQHNIQDVDVNGNTTMRYKTMQEIFEEYVRSDLNKFNSRIPTPDIFGFESSAANNIPYLKLYIPVESMRWSDTSSLRHPINESTGERVFPHDPVGSVPPTLFDPAPIIVDTNDGGSSKTRRRKIRK